MWLVHSNGHSKCRSFINPISNNVSHYFNIVLSLCAVSNRINVIPNGQMSCTAPGLGFEIPGLRPIVFNRVVTVRMGRRYSNTPSLVTVTVTGPGRGRSGRRTWMAMTTQRALSGFPRQGSVYETF